MQNQRLEPVQPYLAKRNHHRFKKGDEMTVDLPGERIRAQVDFVASDNLLQATIINTPVGKAPHGYSKGDLVTVRRGEDALKIEERWVAVSERELQQAEARAKLLEQEEERDRQEEADRIEAIRSKDLAAQAIPRGIDGERKRVLGPRRSKVSR